MIFFLTSIPPQWNGAMVFMARNKGCDTGRDNILLPKTDKADARRKKSDTAFNRLTDFFYASWPFGTQFFLRMAGTVSDSFSVTILFFYTVVICTQTNGGFSKRKSASRFTHTHTYFPI